MLLCYRRLSTEQRVNGLVANSSNYNRASRTTVEHASSEHYIIRSRNTCCTEHAALSLGSSGTRATVVTRATCSQPSTVRTTTTSSVIQLYRPISSTVRTGVSCCVSCWTVSGGLPAVWFATAATSYDHYWSTYTNVLQNGMNCAITP